MEVLPMSTSLKLALMATIAEEEAGADRCTARLVYGQTFPAEACCHIGHDGCHRGHSQGKTAGLHSILIFIMIYQ
jgi:hypothetical protein